LQENGSDSLVAPSLTPYEHWQLKRYGSYLQEPEPEEPYDEEPSYIILYDHTRRM
jgi:hypothetical protein